MPILLTGVAFLAVYLIWHLALAISSRSTGAVRGSQPGRHARKDGESATDVLWLILINPTPATLAVVRAMVARSAGQVRLLIAAAEHNAAHWLADEQTVHFAAGEDRATVLNRAHRAIVARSQRDGATLAEVVVGILDEGARPADDLPMAVARAFADRRVGAVQARVRILDPRLLDAAQQLEVGVIGDALQLRRSGRGAADLTVNGAFFRLSVLHHLGYVPWRAAADEGHDLGLRLRQRGVAILRDRRIGVLVGSRSGGGVLREQVRAMQARLQGWSLARGWRERARWVARLAAWLAPVLLVVGVLTGFIDAVLAGASAKALTATVLVWAAVAMTPAAIWWAARRDQPTRSLRQGALLRPAVLLCRPYVLGWALLRQAREQRTWHLEPRRELPLSEDGSQRAVFVDATGRRRRRISLIAYSTVVALLAYVVIFVYSMGGQPVQPYADAAQAYRAQPRPAPADTDDGITDDTVADSVGNDLVRYVPPAPTTITTTTAAATQPATDSPTVDPTQSATDSPTDSPSADPTDSGTDSASADPTDSATDTPSTDPSTTDSSTDGGTL